MSTARSLHQTDASPLHWDVLPSELKTAIARCAYGPSAERLNDKGKEWRRKSKSGLVSLMRTCWNAYHIVSPILYADPILTDLPSFVWADPSVSANLSGKKALLQKVSRISLGYYHPTNPTGFRLTSGSRALRRNHFEYPREWADAMPCLKSWIFFDPEEKTGIVFRTGGQHELTGLVNLLSRRSRPPAEELDHRFSQETRRTWCSPSLQEFYNHDNGLYSSITYHDFTQGLPKGSDSRSLVQVRDCGMTYMCKMPETYEKLHADIVTLFRSIDFSLFDSGRRRDPPAEASVLVVVTVPAREVTIGDDQAVTSSTGTASVAVDDTEAEEIQHRIDTDFRLQNEIPFPLVDRTHFMVVDANTYSCPSCYLS